MRMVEAFKEAKKINGRRKVRVVNPKFPGIELKLDGFGDWEAWRGEEKVDDFTLTFDDMRDYHWVVIYE